MLRATAVNPMLGTAVMIGMSLDIDATADGPGGAPPSDAYRVARRSVLVAGAAGVGALALAACGGGSGSSAPPTASAGQGLVELDRITVGQAVSASLPDGSPVLVARPSATTASCFSAICPHLGCTVVPDGTQLRCPCHGSTFDLSTGAVTQGPATRGLPPVAVHVADGEVVTGA